MESEHYPYRYQYERVENEFDDSNTSARLIHLNFHTLPTELPFIEGYEFKGHMNLAAHKKSERLLTTSSTPVGACSNRPCKDINCKYHSESPYCYWSDMEDSWFDCGHYYHPPVGHENQCGPIKEN